MKKGTLCLLADFDAENFCREIMRKGAMDGGLGVAAAGLPRHISLGLPYEVTDYDAYLRFAEDFAKTLHPVTVTLKEIGCAPIGDVTGNYSLIFDTPLDLDALRLATVHALRQTLGLDVPEKDGVTGSRGITLGFGKAPFAAYESYVKGFDRSLISGKTLRFDELGVFYYDEAHIGAGNFFCCKRVRLA